MSTLIFLVIPAAYLIAAFCDVHRDRVAPVVPAVVTSAVAITYNDIPVANPTKPFQTIAHHLDGQLPRARGATWYLDIEDELMGFVRQHVGARENSRIGGTLPIATTLKTTPVDLVA